MKFVVPRSVAATTWIVLFGLTVSWLATGGQSKAQDPELANLLGNQDPNLIERCHIIAIDETPIASDQPGIIDDIAVKEGQEVDEGVLLVQIDDREARMARTVAEYQYRARKKQAENEISIEAARKSRDVSYEELKEANEANSKVPGSFSDTDVRRLKLSWERAGLQIELAQFENQVAAAEALAAYAQYEQADSMIARRRLESPFSGAIQEIYRHKGEWINAGDPVLKIVRMDQLRVQGHVNSEDFHWRDVIDRPVEIKVRLPGGGEEVVNARVGFASSTIQDDGTFRITVDIANRRDSKGWMLGPGLRATMRLR